MNEVTIFKHEMFGEVEMIMIEGKPFFAASQIATALGYKNPRKAVLDHCSSKGVTIRDTPFKWWNSKQEIYK